MGGEGSGRKPDMLKSLQEQEQKFVPIADNIFLPNYSGVQAAALKTAAPLGTGGASALNDLTDVVVPAPASGEFLKFDGANWVNAVVGAGSETDPVFMALSGSMYNKYLGQAFSGSLAYIASGSTALFELSGSPTFATLSGSMYNKYLGQQFSGSLGYLPMTLSGSMYDKYLGQQFSGSLGYILSGSTSLFALSGGATVTLGTTAANVLSLSGASWAHILSGSTAHGGIITSGSTALFALSGGATVSLGTHTSDSSDPHGALLTQTNISITSGSTTGDYNTSGSAHFVGVIMDASPTPPTASNFPMGTIYIQYTP
mgnify:CR=1 FL=1